MAEKDLIIGHHIGTTHGFRTTVDMALDSESNVFQIFLGSPHQFKYARRPAEDLLSVKNRCKENKIQLVIHGNYMLNFCNPEDSFIHKAAVKLLVQDLEESVKIGAMGVIIHMGKNVKKNNLTDEEAIENYVKGVQKCLKHSPDNSTIILETGAGQGSEVCTDIIDLGKMYRKFTVEERKRIKFCIDTCHVFSAGYDLSSAVYVSRVFDRLVDNHLKWSNVVCVHLNDSKCKLNCRKDRHEDIGKGFIKLEGLKEFVKLCKAKHIPMVLETPCGTCEETGVRFTHKDQVKTIKDWFN